MCRGDDFIKMWFELCNKELRDDFVHYVAKAYGLEMMSRRWIGDFRNEHNERAIYLPGHKPNGEKRSDCLDDILSYGGP